VQCRAKGWMDLVDVNAGAGLPLDR
jgi:hypothetical protein